MKIKCPGIFCKSKDIQVMEKKKDKYSISKGVFGALAIGCEVGLLLGVEDTVHTYKCMKCGKLWQE